MKNTQVAKFIAVVMCAILMLTFIGSCDFAPYSEQTVIEHNGVKYVASTKKDVCYATTCDMSLLEREIVIEIPDELPSGQKVEGIGGYNGRESSEATRTYYNFHFNTDDYRLESAMNTAIPDGVEIEDYTITVRVGKNVKYIQADYGMGQNFQTMTYNVYGTRRYIRYNVYYEVDSANENYYSVDGILYEIEK